MKRIISLVLSFVLVVSLVPSAFAASDEATSAAQSLYEQGLFSGTGTDANGNPIFDLDRAPTRHEAVTMLVVLLGKGEEAKSGSWNIPFSDVVEWAKPYVGYAYTNGLTAGTSATTYGGNSTITAAQYLTFVLTALDYQNGTDFQWNKAWELSDKIGLTSRQYDAGTTEFTRGDTAIISNNALSAKLNGHSITLLDKVKYAETVAKVLISERIVINCIIDAGKYSVEAVEASNSGDLYTAGQNLSYAWDYVLEAKESCEDALEYLGEWTTERTKEKVALEVILNQINAHSIPTLTTSNWTIYENEIITTIQALSASAMTLTQVATY